MMNSTTHDNEFTVAMILFFANLMLSIFSLCWIHNTRERMFEELKALTPAPPPTPKYMTEPEPV